MADSTQLQLPPGYENAEDVKPEDEQPSATKPAKGVTLPPGYEDAVDVKTDKSMGGSGGSYEAPQGTASKIWETANKPLVPEGRAEKEAKEYTEAPPTLAESEHPIWTGMKKGAAGVYKDAAEMGRSMVTSPLGAATLGLGALGETPGIMGKAAKAGSRIAAGGFGASGVEQAAEGAQDISKKGITPENVKETLGGAGQALLGGAGTVHGTEMGEAPAKKTLAAPVRAASRLATPLSHIIPSVGGIIAADAAGIPHPFIIGGTLGRFVLPPSYLESIFERGRTLGLNDEEANITHLQERYNKAAKEAKQPQKEFDAHQTGREQGIPAPDDVLKAHEKAQKNLADAQNHLKAAQDDYSAKLAGKAPTAPDQPIALSPEQQATQDARPETPSPTNADINTRQNTLMGKMQKQVGIGIPPEQNVKTPGQVQPETFPQTPTAAPRVSMGKAELAGGQGSMGKQRLLTEGVPEPAPVAESVATPTVPQGEVLPPEKPAKPGKLSTLKAEGGKVVDTEDTMQQKIEEGLQGKAKPVAVAPEVKAEAPEALKEEVLPNHEKELKDAAYTPEHEAKAEQVINQHSDQDLIRAAKKAGIDPDQYDFAKRDENRHRTDRARLVKDLLAKLPAEDKTNIARLSDEFNKKDSTLWSEAERNSLSKAQRSRAIMQEHEGGPKEVGGGTAEESKAEEKAGPKGFPDYQEVADYHNANKGFTYNMEKGFMKDQPGFSVAGDFPGTEKVLPSHNLQAKDIQAYVERPDVKAALEADPKNSVGGWMYKGKSHLEVSKLYNDMGDAMDAAKKNNQTSIFDHEHKQEIPTGGTAGDEAQAAAEPAKPVKDMTDKEKEDLAAKGQSGASGKSDKGKTPISDSLMKEYGESSGDPSHTAFILADGKGVDLPPGAIHDGMVMNAAKKAGVDVSVKADTKSPRENVIQDEGAIRIRPRQGGPGGREFSISIPEQGITEAQLEHLNKMAPQMGSGKVMIEVGKTGGDYREIEYGKASDQLEKTLRDLAPIKNAKGSPIDEFGNPTVSGGSPSASAKEAKVPLGETAEKYATAEEKAGITKSPASTQRFIDNMAKIPEVHEYVDIANAGAGARKWYQRSTKAFDAMAEEAPEYFKEDGDRDKFINLLAASSPRQSVAMNLRETLRTWKAYVDEGRPTGDALKDLLNENLTPATSKTPNALKALTGQEMWPDITKNKNFKVPSFARNLRGWLDSATNDGWMSLFAGLDPKEISNAHSYHPLSIATRAAADELGWETAEAQAAIWSFTQALTERGEDTPEEVRNHSEDFVDLMKNDPQVRSLLLDLGVTHANLDAKLGAIGEKPEVSSRSTPTTSRSVSRLRERIETARGKGAVPPPKSAQGELGFREAPAGESRSKVKDADVEFNPEEFSMGKKKAYMGKS